MDNEQPFIPLPFVIRNVEKLPPLFAIGDMVTPMEHPENKGKVVQVIRIHVNHYRLSVPCTFGDRKYVSYPIYSEKELIKTPE